NDLSAAKLAFQNGAARYSLASQLISARPANVIRFFNYDPEVADGEYGFRTTLDDLNRSLTNSVRLASDPDYSIYIGSLFTGAHSLRSFFPLFQKNGLFVGTLPDITFGGIVEGLAEGEVENYVAFQDHLRFSGAMDFPASIDDVSCPDGNKIRFNIHT